MSANILNLRRRQSLGEDWGGWREWSVKCYLNRYILRWRLKVGRVEQSLISRGMLFQILGLGIEDACTKIDIYVRKWTVLVFCMYRKWLYWYWHPMYRNWLYGKKYVPKVYVLQLSCTESDLPPVTHQSPNINPTRLVTHPDWQLAPVEHRSSRPVFISGLQCAECYSMLAVLQQCLQWVWQFMVWVRPRTSWRYPVTTENVKM